MFCTRAAILALIVGFLSSLSALSGRLDDSPANQAVFAAVESNSSIVPTVGIKFPHSSTLARFSPWKARPNIVLAEANNEFHEESDFGPAVVPDQLSSPSSVALTTPRVPTLSPLRC